MQFSVATLLLLTAVGGSMAFPSQTPGYVELSRVPVSGGSLITYGVLGNSQVARNEDKKETSLEKRDACNGKASDTKCDSKKNGAGNELCANVVSMVNDPTHKNQVLASNARWVCYKASDSDKRCCISWSWNVSNLTQGQLFAPASQILNMCNTNGISGVTHHIALGNVCLDLCLSDRTEGCK